MLDVLVSVYLVPSGFRPMFIIFFAITDISHLQFGSVIHVGATRGGKNSGYPQGCPLYTSLREQVQIAPK